MQDLLDLALDNPPEARRRATELLSDEDPEVRSFAGQALGIVLRDSGDLEQALDALAGAIRSARAVGSSDREADVRATLAGTLAMAGRIEKALDEFELAMSCADGETLAKIAMRHAGVLAHLGRHEESLSAMRSALRGFQQVGNHTWEARTRVWLGHLEFSRGRVAEAEHHVARALSLLDENGSAGDRAAATSNMAEFAVARGDIAVGLDRMARALQSYVDAGWTIRFEEVGRFSEAMLAAGLASDAVEMLSSFRGSLPPLDEPRFRLTLASALLAAGDEEEALRTALSAQKLLQAQGREWFALRARQCAIQARARIGDRDGLLPDARAAALSFHAQAAVEAAPALTLAGRLAKGEERRALWRQAASYRTHPNALVRAAAWLARALEREEAGDRGGALRACRAGLDAIDEQRRLLGSSELRAQATTHGRELTEVALRNAAAGPRRLLGWVERTRATTLAQPAMTSDATTIPESLAALRDNGRQLAEARAAGEPTERLERERLRLERAVRAESHTRSAEGADPDRPASAEEVVAGVGDGCLVELVDVDGMLHVLVVHDGRVRRRVAGPTADALALLDPVAMLLRRSARGRPAATDQIGRRLQDTILGDAARLIPDGPVVLAPTTHLHGLPWAVLPALADRPFGVVPSAGQWLRARAVNRPEERRTVLVSGPGLESGGAEVPLLAQQHPTAELLAGKQATLEEVLTSLDGADLVHLAAHGHFRADSPLFSSLDLADGQLTVHDIERIGRAPYRVVLSACESGVLAPVGAQELLGLAAALFGLGTAGLVCSVAEVNDDATAELMVGLHAALAGGDDPATALWEVRRHTTDPIASATAASFLALGV